MSILTYSFLNSYNKYIIRNQSWQRQLGS